MRPWRRRRPAGQPQVPSHPAAQTVLVAPAEAALVRLAVDRCVVDPPWGLPIVAIAHVWPDPRAPGAWVRVQWPANGSCRFVAPIDLQLGHVLEVIVIDGGLVYGWVADADSTRFVLAPASDAPAAVLAAARAVEVWRTSELLAIGDTWRARATQVHRLHGEAE